MITVAGWIGHAAIYPWFTAYLWAVTPAALAFDDYLVDVTEHWEQVKLDQLACSRA